MILRLPRSRLEGDPHALWNAFIHLLASSERADLVGDQLAAHLVFCYESDVQNGGHLQFLLNRPGADLQPTAEALGEIQAPHFLPLLQEAIRRWDAGVRLIVESPEDYCRVALTGEFDDLDAALFAASPTLIELLELHLAAHRDRFIAIDEDQ